MALQVGIVGLPNVGKSTLFQALTKTAVPAENFPFCTIDPNVGVVAVPDERLSVLAQFVSTDKIVPTTIEFVDIAGLVEGAHKGEGLGNQFLQHIREVDAIAEVVRVFNDPNVIHVAGKADPKDDMETIHLELIMADLDTLTKRMASVEKLARGQDKDAAAEMAVLEKLKTALESEQLAHTVELTPEELVAIKQVHLLTRKPFMTVANVDEGGTLDDVPDYMQSLQPVAISAKIESELAQLDEDDASEMMSALGMTETGLTSLVRRGYETLQLLTFFTAGEKEVHAWTVPMGAQAPQAAGVIHSDFEKGFIRAEVVSYEDFVSSGGWPGARDAGKVRMEGKDYVMQDGDIVVFHTS